LECRYRITAIYCVRDLCALFGPSASAQHLLPLALTLAGDAVPNIRFNVAKLFAAIAAPTQTIAWSPEVLKLSVKPALVKLTEDNDVDVRFFAAQALALPVFA
jgi:serine/threonine-protein phosphatase 2A regulatory subunit A